MEILELKFRLNDGTILTDNEKMKVFLSLTPREFTWYTVKSCFSMIDAGHNFVIMQGALQNFGDRNLYNGYCCGKMPINKALLDLVLESGVRNKILIKNIIANMTVTAKDLSDYEQFNSGMHVWAWLSRSDCPPELIREFSSNKCKRNRLKIASHPNTPKDVLTEYIYKDISSKVRKRAFECLVKRNFS